MATGTGAGLTRQKKAQSVYKHNILKRYILPYAAKTASICTPKRCVVVDGFAGRGRYDDGSDGSAERLMIEAQKLKARSRVDVFLVEKDRADFEHLDRVADEYRGRGQVVETRQGDCVSFLDEIVEFSRNASMFLFLDPCGVNLPMDDLANVVSGPRRGAYPATEVLLNISADAIRRSAGLVYRHGDDANTDKVDTMCGGRWWRRWAVEAFDAAGTGTWEAAAEEVVVEYARRLAEKAQAMYVVAPVRRKQGVQPVYYLVFLTRNPQGIWLFGNAAAKARYDWLAFLDERESEESGTDPLISVEEQIKNDRAEAATKVRQNIEGMMAAGVKRFVPAKVVDDLLGSLYGEVEERVPHQVLRTMEKEGVLRVVERRSSQYASTYAIVS